MNLRAVFICGVWLLLVGRGMAAEKLIASQQGERGNATVWVVATDGTKARKIATGESPQLSPDGTRVAFERGQTIWVANTDGTKIRKIATGARPRFSPDGTRLAFQAQSDWNDKAFWSRIAVADLASTKIQVFEEQIPLGRCYDALWSPDGKQILFGLTTGKDWHLGLISADGTNFHYVKKGSSGVPVLQSACWAHDGGSIYAQDGKYLYQLGLNGAELKKSELSTLLPGFSLETDTVLAPSLQDHFLLIDVTNKDEPVKAPGWEGAARSLWVIDLASGKADRLTPEGMLAWNGYWLSANKIVFIGQTASDEAPAIYEMALPGKEKKVVVKNSDTFSGAALPQR